jgi:hypothetical protein
MKQSLLLAGALLLASPILASACSADGIIVSYHQTSPGRYIVSIDITSIDCSTAPCSGTVKYSFTYHSAADPSNVAKDRGMASFTISKGNTQGHVSHEHVASFGVSDPVIDDVGVDEVSCSSP